jgi:formiminoglutamase
MENLLNSEPAVRKPLPQAKASLNALWSGRIDGWEDDHLRWHQKIVCQPIEDIVVNLSDNRHYAIVGFESDEGVARNKGRIGAKTGPSVLRQFCANFPIHSPNIFHVIDLGNVVCNDHQLEQAQELLSDEIATIQTKNYVSVVFGGGHELTYPHFLGIRKSHSDKKIGIINFDAHFDIREPEPTVGVSSGTGFWQIAQQEEKLNYLAIGIQRSCNTQKLFDRADSLGVQYILAEAISQENKSQIIAQINTFAEGVDLLYCTVCLDVFSAAFAPGVSAPAGYGLLPDPLFLAIFRTIINNKKLVAFDIAELNPAFDQDNRTARLAASLVYELIAK